jgi:diguanylate cyclase (GGDEF)-like protein
VRGRGDRRAGRVLRGRHRAIRRKSTPDLGEQVLRKEASGADSRSVDNGPQPFRMLPIASMMIFAQLTGLADTALNRPVLFGLSSGFLAMIVVPMLALRGHQPQWLLRATPFVYIVSATLLILSLSDPHSGLSIVLLVPVVSVAMRGTRADSVATVIAMLAAFLLIALVNHAGGLVLVRTLTLWGAMGAFTATAIHSLRERMTAAQGELANQAKTDPLTGLANRREFYDATEKLRGRRRFVVISIDIDGLKEVNDTRGHHLGDQLIQGVANACVSASRKGDVVARLGGDEFAVFVADADHTDGQVVCQRMRDAIQRFAIDGFRASASIGFATGAAEDSVEDVLRDADRAMYEEKRRNQSVTRTLDSGISYRPALT